MEGTGTVLIVGGYGTVGTQVARMLRRRHPGLRLALGGRHPDQGRALAEELGLAETVRIDVDAARPLAGLAAAPSCVLAVVNDVDDHLLFDAVGRSWPWVDITRWTDKVRDSVARLALLGPASAPVVFASSWMAALPAILAAGMAAELKIDGERGGGGIDSIELSILYAIKDKSGPNSVEYMDRLAVPFAVVQDGRTALVRPFGDGRTVAFADGVAATVYRFDTPDQFSLPLLTGAASVAARIGFDDRVSTALLRVLIRSGLWAAISGPRLTRLRHALLHNPGAGDAHRVRIDVTGRDGGGAPRRLVADLNDPQGQTHLTAVGAVVQVERVLGLEGHVAARAGVQFAEGETDAGQARAALLAEGVCVREIAES